VIKLAVCGALGRMGRSVLEVALEEGLEVVGGLERPERVGSGDLGKETGIKELEGVPLTAEPEELFKRADVVIEFSGDPRAAVGYAGVASALGVPIVIGTTGLEESDVEELRRFSESCALLYSPNMSLGVNLLFRLVEFAAKALKGKPFDEEIFEVHHRYKKDAPSGTAIKLAQIVAAVTGKEPVFCRKEGPRKDGEVGLCSLRGGDVVGEHTVFFFGPEERLELTHRAGSRKVFARGAVEAAKWIKGKPPGFYDMFDVLGI